MILRQNVRYFESNELYAEEDLNNQVDEFLGRKRIHQSQIIDLELKRFSHSHRVGGKLN